MLLSVFNNIFALAACTDTVEWVCTSMGNPWQAGDHVIVQPHLPAVGYDQIQSESVQHAPIEELGPYNGVYLLGRSLESALGEQRQCYSVRHCRYCGQCLFAGGGSVQAAGLVGAPQPLLFVR